MFDDGSLASIAGASASVSALSRKAVKSPPLAHANSALSSRHSKGDTNRYQSIGDTFVE
jgi:hypothetical protein